MSELALLLPVGVVLATALVVVFLDLAIKPKDRYLLPWMGMGGLVLALIAVCQTQWTLMDQTIWFKSYGLKLETGVFNPIILNGAFCLDRFGISAWAIVCVAGLLAILAAPAPGQDEEHPLLTTGEYFGLILLAVAGMMLLCVAYDWVTLLLALEIMSIATYILTGSGREDLKGNEAAIKYLVLGAFSTAFLLMGIAFYYGAFGHTSIGSSNLLEKLPEAERFARQNLLWVGMGLVLVGALFKLGAAPFHFWVPDVYQGAPTAVTGLMAVGVKTAAFVIAARLVFDTFAYRLYAAKMVDITLIIAVLTMVVGNILAMRQTNVKRMLAYSGIAHTGYILLALIVIPGGSSETIESHTKAILFYLLTYGIMTLGAFGAIALIREDGKPLENLEDFTGLAKSHPGLAICTAIFMFSMAGLPPTGGFFAKFMIFRSAVEQAAYKPEIITGVVIGILTSVASLYYYLRVVVAMYMPEHGTDEEGKVATCKYAWNTNLLIYAAGLITLIVGVVPNWFWF